MIIRFQGQNFENETYLSAIGRGIGAAATAAISGKFLKWLIKELAISKKEVTNDYVTNDVGGITTERRNQLLLQDMFSNIVSLSLYLAYYYYGNFAPTQPAAMIAGVPLGTVTEISHAISMEDLKYRSKGGVFLAHQEGGNQTVRFVGKAWGPNRFLFLIMLDLLFMYGQAKVVDMFQDAIIDPNDAVAMTPETTPWQVFDKYALDEGKDEFHLTFPVITRQRVYLNMYIETYEYTESIENGLNCITYTIFMRKYTPEPLKKFSATWVENEEGEREEVQFYYADDEDDELNANLRLFSMRAEYGISMAFITYRTFLILSGNSAEENIACITNYAWSSEISGGTDFDLLLKERYADGYLEDKSLVGLSTMNKEEMMQVA